MESHHQLKVIELENEVYRRPFEWSRIGPATKERIAKDTTRHRTVPKGSARLLVSDLSPNENAAAVPMSRADSHRQDLKERLRLSRDEARRLISGAAPFSTPSPSPASASFLCSPQNSEHSRSSRASETSTRQLRAHAKIADRHLTEAYFQLQLQQHISQHYRSHPFSLSDLRSDTTLSSLAQRLVSIRLQCRLASRSADTSRTASFDTSEQHSEKVRRLFEWAIRKMMQDGFITLAETDDSRLLKPNQTTDASSTDVYRLVTPEYLLAPLNKLIGNSGSASPCNAAAHDAEELTVRLRVLDDRFRNIHSSLVQDSLALYHARRAPIVID